MNEISTVVEQLAAAESPATGRILIIDDDMEVRTLVRHVLEREGFAVLEAPNGLVGHARAMEFKPDLIIIDWMMPELDGHDAAIRLKADPFTAAIPIVMLTSRSQPEDKVAALDAGVQDFLNKPFEAKALTESVRQQLRWRHLLADNSSAVVAEAPARPAPTAELPNLARFVEVAEVAEEQHQFDDAAQAYARAADLAATVANPDIGNKFRRLAGKMYLLLAESAADAATIQHGLLQRRAVVPCRGQSHDGGDGSQFRERGGKPGFLKIPFLMAGNVVDRGLEGVVVGETVLSNVEGQVGRLTYRGYDIHDLAVNATFEEIVHLLLYGELPTQDQLSALNAKLGPLRVLPPALIAMLKAIPVTAWPMDVLRTGISALAHFVPHKPDGSHTSDPDAALDLIAKTPSIVAAFDRIRRGLEPIAPDPALRSAANFLWMRSGEKPIKEAEAALDMYLVLLADHSYNASTFSARVTASTNADIYGAITAAVATLAGDLHGGAPSKVMTMLEEIGTPDKAEPYVRNLLGKGQKIMGMGHREYKIRDPRAEHLETSAKALTEASGSPWYTVARALEDASNAVLQELKPGKKIYANVEFYTAPTLSSLDIPKDEFTCLFACGRMAGWTAHVLEQMSNNRLIRPQAAYIGPDVHASGPIAGRNGHTNGALN